MGAVIVAICAIAASSVWSFLALRRSGQTLALAEATAQLTEDRYRADRIEARKRQLIDALVDVSYRVNNWITVNAQYAAALKLNAVRMPSMSPEAAIESAITVQNIDMEKQRPALAEAHRALQVAVLLFTDTTDVLSPVNKALFDHQLDMIGKDLLQAQKAVQAVNAETPQQIQYSTDQLKQRRAQVSNRVGDLIKLGAVIIAAGQDGTQAIDP